MLLNSLLTNSYFYFYFSTRHILSFPTRLRTWRQVTMFSAQAPHGENSSAEADEKMVAGGSATKSAF